MNVVVIEFQGYSKPYHYCSKGIPAVKVGETFKYVKGVCNGVPFGSTAKVCEVYSVGTLPGYITTELTFKDGCGYPKKVRQTYFSRLLKAYLEEDAKLYQRKVDLFVDFQGKELII